MSRVAIIGNGGGGKSTLAIKLGKALGIRVHHIDRLQFRPGWQRTPDDELARAHEEILAAGTWIIDGWGGWQLIERRFAAADTIVVIDLPIWVHYWWALKRQVTSTYRGSPDRPENCPLLPKTLEMMRVLWVVHRQMQPRLLQLVERNSEGRQVIRLHTRRDLRQFVRAHCEAA